MTMTATEMAQTACPPTPTAAFVEGDFRVVPLVVVDGLPEELLGTSEQVSKQPAVNGNDDEATLRTSMQHNEEASAVAQPSSRTVVSLGQAETPEHGPARPLVSQEM